MVTKVGVNVMIPRGIGTNNLTHHVILWNITSWYHQLLNQELTLMGVLLHLQKRANGSHGIGRLIIGMRDLLKLDMWKILLETINHYFVGNEFFIFGLVLIINLFDDEFRIIIDGQVLNVPLYGQFKSRDECFVLNNVIGARETNSKFFGDEISLRCNKQDAFS